MAFFFKHLNLIPKSNDKENNIQFGSHDKETKETKENPKETKELPKETKELPKEIIEAINNRDLTEVQFNLLSLTIAMPSITLTKMAEELNLTIDQVRTLRKKLEKKGIFLCRKGATKKGIWEIKLK